MASKIIRLLWKVCWFIGLYKMVHVGWYGVSWVCNEAKALLTYIVSPLLFYMVLVVVVVVHIFWSVFVASVLLTYYTSVSSFYSRWRCQRWVLRVSQNGVYLPCQFFVVGLCRCRFNWWSIDAYGCLMVYLVLLLLLLFRFPFDCSRVGLCSGRYWFSWRFWS